MESFQYMFGAVSQKTLSDMFVSSEDYLEKIIDKIPIMKDDVDREKINPPNALLSSMAKHTEEENAIEAIQSKHEEDQTNTEEDMNQQQITTNKSSRKVSGKDQDIVYSALDSEFPVREKRSDSFVEKLMQGVSNLLRKGSKDIGPNTEIKNTEEEEILKKNN